jgi:hypothetical protein
MTKQKKFLKRKVEFLKDFLIFALGEMNKYLKINDPKGVDEYNMVIAKTLKDIETLETQIHEINFNEYNARLENDC